MSKLTQFILCLSIVGSSVISIAPVTQANLIHDSDVSSNEITNQANENSQTAKTKTVASTNTTTSTQEASNNVTVSAGQTEEFCYQYVGIPSRVYPGLGLTIQTISCE